MQDLFQSLIHKIRINFNPVCSILRCVRCDYFMQVLLTISFIFALSLYYFQSASELSCALLPFCNYYL